MSGAKQLAEALRAIAATIEAEPSTPAASAPRYYTKRSAPCEGRVWDRAVQEIATFRPGREVMVKAEDLHAWIEAHPVERPAKPANDETDRLDALREKFGLRRGAA